MKKYTLSVLVVLVAILAIVGWFWYGKNKQKPAQSVPAQGTVESERGSIVQNNPDDSQNTPQSGNDCPKIATTQATSQMPQGFHLYEDAKSGYTIVIPDYAQVVNKSAGVTEFDLINGKKVALRMQVSARPKNTGECSLNDMLITKIKSDYFLKTNQETAPDWESLAQQEKKNYQEVKASGFSGLQRISKKSSDGSFPYELETDILGNDFVYTVSTLQAGSLGIEINPEEEALYNGVLNSFRVSKI